MAGFLDLEDYITEWAWQMFDALKSKDEGKIPKEHLSLQINWSKIRFQHAEPEYTDKHMPPEPKGQVIFTTTFVNDTNEEHEYSFKTERTTRSTCEIEMFKGVTTGASLELSVKTPCEVFEANAGFSREVEVSKSEGETIEKELVWSVDSSIKLPPQTKTLANLIINQQEYESKFKINSKFWGRVIVCVNNRKDNNNFMRAIEGDVKEIFRGKDGFAVKGKTVTYVSEGKCSFRFGIEQSVHLQQLSLADNNNKAIKES